MLIRDLRKSQKTSGFSLIEMAVVLLIVSALLGGLLISIGTTSEINNRNSTEAMLQDIVDALYGFAQANDRLPCPATAASNGFSAPAAAGACSGGAVSVGFVPSGTLGLSGPLDGNNLLSDPWGNPYRYVVSNSAANAFTSANMGNATVATIASGANLRVCDSASCAAVVAANLPAVVLSMGADWAAAAAGADSKENSREATTAGYRMPNDADFVSSVYIEDVFDDMLNWVSPSLLVSKLISAGQLP